MDLNEARNGTYSTVLDLLIAKDEESSGILLVPVIYASKNLDGSLG
jgi:hypothetical protein